MTERFAELLIWRSRCGRYIIAALRARSFQQSGRAWPDRRFGTAKSAGRGLNNRICNCGSPFQSADRKNSQPTVFRQIPKAIGEIPFALPPEARDTMLWHAFNQIWRQIDVLQKFQPIQQPVCTCRIVANLELTQPHEPCEPIINVFRQ